VTGCSNPDRLGFTSDPEVEQLRAATAGDSTLLGEIAVEDEILMRVVDGRAHIPEEPQPRVDGQTVRSQ
jgi:hypothetical protein